MKIGYRIFLGFAAVFALGFIFLVAWIMSDVNVQPKKSMEESLVDTAHILAAFIEQEIREGEMHLSRLEQAMLRARRRGFSARIYELTKKRVTLHVYVTNRWGIVLYDSDQGKREGEDFSDWIDVKRTLAGEYGARTTRTDPDDPASSEAFVAAPISWQSEILGVLTVIKPWKSINSFIKTTRKAIIITAVLGFVFVLILSFFISQKITRPILKLTDYARWAAQGIRTELPVLGKSEVGALGKAFEDMRESLEGKKYIEKYVQTLTHQIKGPLASIYGAAELLKEGPAPGDRDRFIENISKESARIKLIVERLLELSAIEQRRSLEKVEKIYFREIIEEAVEGVSVNLKKKDITCTTIVNEAFFFKGEKFLVKQALFCLLHNAVDFTPPGGEIIVTVSRDERAGVYLLSVEDSGSGIPGYALPQVFDRFYSLPRPGTERRSSGLGLFLVREVALLHGGTITIGNNPGKGATATLRLPI